MSKNYVTQCRNDIKLRRFIHPESTAFLITNMITDMRPNGEHSDQLLLITRNYAQECEDFYLKIIYGETISYEGAFEDSSTLPVEIIIDSDKHGPTITLQNGKDAFTFPNRNAAREVLIVLKIKTQDFSLYCELNTSISNTLWFVSSTDPNTFEYLNFLAGSRINALKEDHRWQI